jgi:hypothetical protein
MTGQTGIDRIAAERRRQIDGKGWTPEHDDEHTGDELSLAAACYAAPEPLYAKFDDGDSFTFSDPWPWDCEWDKRPRDRRGQLFMPSLPRRIRMLEKAGALIAAEIDRLLRQAQELQK